MLSDADLALGLKKDMVHLLQQLHCKSEPYEDLVTSPVRKKARKDAESLEEMQALKTKQVIWVLESRLCMRRAKQTPLCTRAHQGPGQQR